MLVKYPYMETTDMLLLGEYYKYKITIILLNLGNKFRCDDIENYNSNYSRLYKYAQNIYCLDNINKTNFMKIEI